MSLPNVLEQKNNLYGLIVITGVLGGLFLLIDDFTGWYWYAGSSQGWGWIGFPSLLENLADPTALLFLPLFLVLAGGLFYCAALSGYSLLNSDYSPTKQLLLIGTVLAGLTFIVSLLGGVFATVSLITEDLDDWWLGGAFYGGFIGGGFTAFFMYLLWRDS